ncbi:TPA: hypothetical protein ACGPPO_006679 [Pseudomonas aeruginosa]|uniref:hypothetical protein n=1 Tax=Pseudomonas aeruginosa TaxID=287 RepID=UPI0005B3CBBA|nr:hypothetical protein [Pseudomonas aeruginosa]MBG7460249.1 hypothetical protein [Pseudomonas aeruginosa]MDG3857826.1 hypothetical protein [Pseudomonas aeruginosa]MDG4088449.1 hypothetical protein [Pseudomonas aeruginosa]MDQ9140230.1 hypothetical protein [Pseudomonas aeruginosa]MEA8541212.1 hypothetical protein [Pseudomonas aeruginosa]
MTTTNPASYCMDTHEQFILDELLPLIVNHAAKNHHPADAVALASFLALGTILQSQGMDRDSLVFAIDASLLPTHDLPETVQ